MTGSRTQAAVTSLKSVAKRYPLVEQVAREATGRARIKRFRRPDLDRWVSLRSTTWRPRPPTDERIGIYLAGGCDTPALFQMGSLLERDLRATIAMLRVGNITSNNPELLLQQLSPPTDAQIAEVAERLRLGPESFASGYFDPDFAVPGLPRLGRFAKDVVVLSLGSAMTRTLYRHNEHGFLVDPGGNWLDQDLDRVLDERREVIRWFGQHFTSTGRPTVDRFKDSFRRLVGETRDRLGAEVLLLNTLVVEPGDPTHNYQLKRRPEALRRRAFHIAAVELSAELDVPIIDVDHLAKGHGVSSTVDFAHFPAELEVPLAGEAHRLLAARGVFG